MSDGEKPQLGDLLAPGYVAPAASEETPETEIVLTPDHAERLLAGAAKLYGLDPSEVLEAFRKGGVLSELIGRALGVDNAKRDSFWEAIDVIEQVRGDGWKGKAAFVEAARRLASPDAAGKARRNISAGSLETYWNERRGVRRKYRVAELFLPDDWRPPRKAAKRSTRSDG